MANPANIREVFIDGMTREFAQPASSPGDTFPVGTVLQFGGSSAPSGWQLCDGTALSRAGQANLFAVIATTFGVGDGSTTFNVPDLRDRVPVGVSGTKALGSTGGAATVALALAELPSHNHGGVTGSTTPGNSGAESANHSHSYNAAGANTSVQSGGGATVAGPRSTISTGTESASHVHASANHNHSIPSAGSGTAHNNLQPYVAVNHIIKL